MGFAAGLKRASEHPLAGTILKGAEEYGLTLTQVADFQSLTGRGVAGQVEDRQVAMGNTQLMIEAGIATELFTNSIEAPHKQGQTVMLMAIDGKAADFLCVADPIKETTRKARAELKKEGIKVVMLTGDNRTTAEFFAQSLVIEQVYA